MAECGSDQGNAAESGSAKVEHQPERSRFLLTTGGEPAVMDYRVQSPEGDARRRIDFTHTYVPPDFRGKGLAEKLVRHGLQWARDQGFEITASCWYVRKFLRS